ncbi:MAG: hypothetical protein O7C73_07440, partial [Nitrospirae bacterium]|nr:hypothetical protein [Nitrospirota bacterium]
MTSNWHRVRRIDRMYRLALPSARERGLHQGTQGPQIGIIVNIQCLHARRTIVLVRRGVKERREQAGPVAGQRDLAREPRPSVDAVGAGTYDALDHDSLASWSGQ